jgi:hypothetical protein
VADWMETRDETCQTESGASEMSRVPLAQTRFSGPQRRRNAAEQASSWA